MLSVTMLDSWSFSYTTQPHGHMYFVEEFLYSSTLKCFGIELIVLMFAWKLFPKLHCVLNMLTMNCLALESVSSDSG